MSTDNLRNEIEQHFGEAVVADDALLRDCMSLCRTFNISAQDLSFKWQAINFNNKQSLQIFTPQSVVELRAQLQSGQAKAVTSTISRNFTRGRGTLHGKLKHVAAKKLDETLSTSKVIFQGPRMDELSRKSRSYRYMHEKVLERSEVLDERIDCFAELVQRHYHIDELGDPACATEETVTVVGRIVLDAEAASSGVKINESSLVLESSRMMGSGVRVPIRLTSETRLRGSIKGTTGVSFFPGAIVALRGRNGGGGFFSVDDVLAVSNQSSTHSHDPSTSFSMYIACGPFTADSDLYYKPWSQLFQKLTSAKPADCSTYADHPQVVAGDIGKTPSEIFERHYQEALRDFLLQSPGSISELRSFGTDPRIHYLPNPCRFSLNGVSFGVTSVDVLFHLRKEEYFKRLQDVDPSVSDHAQTSDAMVSPGTEPAPATKFLSYLPVPLDVSHEVNLDVTHSEGLSRLKQFSKVSVEVSLPLHRFISGWFQMVDNSMVINPSFVQKGFYAQLSYAGQASGIPRDRVDVEISKVA
ncbi:DNA polymerase alpha subunit B [Pisolithus croceorrhizus]|nr:DNA polymerase alpha subunit B [Pisolithus croceorrhizus]